MSHPNVLTKPLPVWSCSADVQQRTDYPVFARAEMTFTCSDGRVHTYTEERVVDPSPEAIAKLCRDQHAQLVRMDQLANNPVSGTIDLAPPVPVDDALAVQVDASVLQREAYADDLRVRIKHLKLIELGLLQSDDKEVVDVQERLTLAMSDPAERATVVALIE